MGDINPIDMQKALKGADYPASREDLVSLARGNGADQKTVEALSHVHDSRFEGPDEVQRAVFGDR